MIMDLPKQSISLLNCTFFTENIKYCIRDANKMYVKHWESLTMRSLPEQFLCNQLPDSTTDHNLQALCIEGTIKIYTYSTYAFDINIVFILYIDTKGLCNLTDCSFVKPPLCRFKDKGCNMTWTYLYIDDEQSRLCFDALAIISQMRVIYAL